MTDETGSPLPGVMVEIKNIFLEYTTTTVTDVTGHFFFQNLDLGNYKLKFTVEGFKTLSYDNLIIDPQNRNFNINLETYSASIEITGGTISYPKYLEVTLGKDLSWPPLPTLNLPLKEILSFKDGRFHSPTGIAKIGVILKKLENITEIPIDDRQYKCDGLAVKENCVYALKADYSKSPVIILIKVLDLTKEAVKFQYYIGKTP